MNIKKRLQNSYMKLTSTGMNKKLVTIYLSSVGGLNAINIIDALNKSDIKFRIVGGDCDPLATGLFLIDKGYVVPQANDSEFIPKVIEICKREKVDIALPIYSADFPAFEQHKQDFVAEGIRTYAPSKEAWNICDDKYQVAKFLSTISVPHPQTWTYVEAIKQADTLVYPLFLKLRSGSGTKKVEIVESAEGLKFLANSRFVIQEYIDGEEFTVDVFSNLEGKMIAASPRKRTKVYGGLSVRGETILDTEIISYTKAIVEALKLPGPSNVQCKRCSDSSLKFYDVNPRFASGGLPLAVAAGLNSPEMLIRLLMGWKIPRKIDVIEGMVMCRYWTTVFVQKKDDKYEMLDRY